MTDPTGNGLRSVPGTIENALRGSYGKILSVLIRQFGDFALAEDALQDAIVGAMDKWSDTAMPDRPEAWLIQTARRKAIDQLRRRQNFEKKAAEMRLIKEIEQQAGNNLAEHDFGDERLRLIFTCCHPALQRDAQVALTLKTLCGLSTEEIASAFLVAESTMAQRIVRAKAKIKRAGIPYQVPSAELLAERLPVVLSVVYLIFNEGYYRSRGDALISLDLCGEAIFLTEMLLSLISEEPESLGLYALLQFHQSRMPARVDENDELVDLENQDRALWDRDAIIRADRMLRSALMQGRPGSYQIQAAISGLHCHAPSFGETDWQQVLQLYRTLLNYDDNPVVSLNLAVALCYAEGAAEALEFLENIPHREAMNGYHPWHTARAMMLLKVGEYDEAKRCYRTAISLCNNESEKRHLKSKLDQIDCAA